MFEKIAETGAAKVKLEIGDRFAGTTRPPRAPFPARRRTKTRALLPVGAEFVVSFALLGVAQDFVRLVDFLELFLRGLFVFGDVRVILPREFAEGLANLLVARAAPDAQCLVVILKLDRHM